jgi:catechol 2,3-dioxygenase-like lactoylglutathione lyase family enzyme
MAELPPLPDGFVVNHFIASDDVERSARFYTEVLGRAVVFGPVPTVVELSNSFIVINTGGGPTDDKPTVTLETPRDPDRTSSFLNLIEVGQTTDPQGDWIPAGWSPGQ